MKVVLFCGGFGLRLRDYKDHIPKPMVPVGPRPILWHIMRYYAHFGHSDFVLCLGHQGDVIKDYFLRYDEAISNDFVLSGGGRHVKLLSSDIDDWRITFADSGLRSNLGQRLRSVRRHLEGEEMFLVNYGDVVTDAPLDEYIERFRRSGKVAAFLAVRPTYSFHIVQHEGDDDVVSAIQSVEEAELWINGGYFMFRREIFDYMEPGEELVVEPFRRLVKEEQLLAFRYTGFWAPMDTLKDRETLERLHDSGRPPWAVWQPPEPA
jgi:glucose-1-phosphate cytidylyltransferase